MSNSVRPHRQQPTRLPRPWDSLGKNSGEGCHFLLQCIKVKSESEVSQSCQTLLRPHGLQPTRLLCPWDFPGKSTGAGCHRLLREDRDCTFSPVSLVRNNNIILVGKADQFWQPWWERWILHLPRLGAGRTLSGGNAKRVYMSKKGGSGFTHTRDNRAGWAGGLALEFLKPQGSC